MAVEEYEPRVKRAAERPNDPMFHYVVEAIGTLALIYASVSSIVMTQNGNLVAIALAHGLAFAVMFAASGHISGGAFNPALVVALWIGRQLSFSKAIGYIIAQLVGALVGAYLVLLTFPTALVVNVGFGTPGAGPGFTAINALVAEIIGTFFLTYVYFGVVVDKRGPAAIASLAIGLTITMDIFATGAVSGAAMNPARWFGPAIMSGNYRTFWVWWAGPIAGAALAAILYYYGYLHGRHTHSEEVEVEEVVELPVTPAPTA